MPRRTRNKEKLQLPVFEYSFDAITADLVEVLPMIDIRDTSSCEWGTELCAVGFSLEVVRH